MLLNRSLRADLLLALSYFLLASLAVSLTRFDGGVAFLWVATSLLIPALVRRPRRRWGTTLALCGLASCAATGLFGFGWMLAVPFAGINLIEAYLGAVLLTRTRSGDAPMRSLGWLGSFVLSVGLVAPAVAALLASALTSSVGRPFLPTFIDFFAGHALGNLTFAPVFTLIVSGRLRSMLRDFNAGRAVETAALLALVAASCLATFASSGLPLLFLPCGPIILAIFRGREIGAAGSIVLLALIGGGFTAMGQGPVHLIDSPIGERMQFFQFYLAAVVLTVLPVTADLRNRARLHRELRYSEERLKQAAMTDSLTGLPNRRAFWEAAERRLSAIGAAPAGCIAILDIDHFKQVNDVHGHDVGDAVLRQFAVEAATCLREGDIVARLGGEEFGLLLPGADLISAARICERLRESIAQMGVPSRKGLIRVTISGGVSLLGADGLETALRCADLALYEAKSGGRDQLCLAA